MNDAFDLLEGRLLAGYRQQTRAYERALGILENRQREVNGEINWVPALRDALHVVAELDAGLAADKAEWREAKCVAGAELRAVLDCLAQKIKTLAEQVDGQVAELLARKQRLVPDMDDFIRQRWMLNAYEQFGQAAKT